jgi:hypothetical protein
MKLSASETGCIAAFVVVEKSFFGHPHNLNNSGGDLDHNTNQKLGKT